MLVGTVRDAIRFASPVSYPALASLEHTIRGDISALGVLIDGGHDGVEALCMKICEEVKDRSNRYDYIK